MFFKLLILAFIILILFFLGQSFFQIFIQKTKNKESSEISLKAVKFFSWRVALSLTLLIIVVITKLYLVVHNP